MTHPAPRSGDAGFTLPELLISMVIATMVVGAVGAALITSLRSNEQASGQMRSSRDAQALTQYLLPDIQSAGPLAADATAPDTGTHCLTSPVPSATARNVLHLSWNESSLDPDTEPTIRHTSYWAFRFGAEGPWSLVRYSCAENGDLASTNVLRQLRDGSSTTAVVADDRLGLQVTSLADDRPFTFEVTGRPRTPAVSP